MQDLKLYMADIEAEAHELSRDEDLIHALLELLQKLVSLRCFFFEKVFTVLIKHLNLEDARGGVEAQRVLKMVC